MAKTYEKDKQLDILAVIKAVVFLVAVMLAFVLLLVIVQRSSETPSTSVGNTSIDVSVPPMDSSLPPLDESIPTVTPINNYKPVEIPTADIHKGSTILVNNANAFVFPDDEFVQTMAGVKNDDYYVRDRSVLLRLEVTEKINALMSEYRTLKSKKNVMIYNGYISYETQKGYYDKAIDNHGYDAGSMKQAKPGHSDAHTGYSFDLRMYYNGETSPFLGEDESSWIIENAHRYGFIVRFPDGSETATGFEASISKLRYVGIPHSMLIRNNDLTLEEYINNIKLYSYDGNHWYCEHDGSTYEVYYAPASSGETTTVYVPTDKEYTISGNNVDGFIITIKY